MGTKSSKSGQPETQAYPADKARQGEIILRKPWQRIVFFGGLVGLLIVGLLAGFLLAH
ncbi:hypothetical protein [Microbaculum marinum]|uniref:Peptide ABC transporter permease n=1 Tax=Microbaculum marinum TaxID=1764581 RepID=A0AAW9RWE1_9HYPH